MDAYNIFWYMYIHRVLFVCKLGPAFIKDISEKIKKIVGIDYENRRRL